MRRGAAPLLTRRCDLYSVTARSDPLVPARRSFDKELATGYVSSGAELQRAFDRAPLNGVHDSETDYRALPVSFQRLRA